MLSTLGKNLEAVIAERISYAEETDGLLPATHCGARKTTASRAGLALLFSLKNKCTSHEGIAR